MKFSLKFVKEVTFLKVTHEDLSILLKSPLVLPTQIQQWEQNLEKFHLDLFRMRCYLASLQGGELPNPKSLLAATSRPSKLALGRLGVLSVSSFHALVSSLRRLLSSRKRRLCMPTLLQLVAFHAAVTEPHN